MRCEKIWLQRKKCVYYPPISLLSLFSNFFKNVIYKRLTSFIEKEIIVSNNQVFFKNISTIITAFNDFYKELIQLLQKTKLTGSIFCDLSKAFNYVHHEICLKNTVLQDLQVSGSIATFKNSMCSNFSWDVVSYYNPLLLAYTIRGLMVSILGSVI